MSIINVDMLYNNDLNKKELSLKSLKNYSEECVNCGRPSLLHKGGLYTRKEREPPEIINNIWMDFCARVRSKVKVAKAEQ